MLSDVRQLKTLEGKLLLVFLTTRESLWLSRLAELVGSSTPNVHRCLQYMIQLGLVEKIGHGMYRATDKAGRYRKRKTTSPIK